jgi:beta-lactamase regulating signal transducer with metallopeptidase domain
MNAPIWNSTSVWTWVWQTSLAATVLIGLVLLLQFCFRKVLPARWCYALWLLVLLRLLLPVSPASSFSIFNLGEKLFLSVSKAQNPLGTIGPKSVPSDLPAETIPVKAIEAPLSADSASVPPAKPSHRESSPSLLLAAQLFWLLGAAGYALAIMIQHGKLASWVKHQKPVSDARITSLLASAKAVLGLNCEVRVIETNCLRTPALFGLGKPHLLLPKAMLETLEDRELRLVILHELIHVQRRDVFLNWILILVQALHWFNPAVWLALKRLRADRELVCDAALMTHLSAEERHAYGGTLIKLLDFKPSFAPSLVPILNHQHEIQRRIIMISQFKPASRLATIALAMLLIALGCLTFTGAAEKETPAKTPDPPKSVPDLDKQREAYERDIRILEQEFEKHNQMVKEKQRELDKVKLELQISDAEEVVHQSNTPEPEILRKLESLRIETQADFRRIDTLYEYLGKLSRAEFKKAVSTASPDPLMTSLLEQQFQIEQKLADLTDLYAPDHPDVKRVRRVLEKIQQQVDDRLDGILNGLKAKRNAEQARLEDLTKELERYRRHDIEMAIERRPYFEIKRDLENLKMVRDRLQIRIIQEKIDAAIPRSVP